MKNLKKKAEVIKKRFKKNMTEKMKAVFSLDVKKKERKEKKRGTSDRDEKENFQ